VLINRLGCLAVTSFWGNQQFYMQDDLPRKQPLRLATPQTYIEESTSDIVGTFRLPQ